jgi:hypothetical protein
MKLIRLLPLGLLLGAGLFDAASTQAAPVLKSVTVDLPVGDRQFPGGVAADAINSNSTACHSPGMVLSQPNLTKGAWEDEVHKMITAYKAPIDEADVPAIVV